MFKFISIAALIIILLLNAPIKLILFLAGLYIMCSYGLLLGHFKPDIIKKFPIVYLLLLTIMIIIFSLVISWARKEFFLGTGFVLILFPQLLIIDYLRRKKKITLEVFSEKRRAPRAKVILDLWYKKKTDLEWKEALTRDISISGLRVLVTERVDVGERLLLRIKLAEEGWPINAEAEVVWLREVNGSFELGLKFVKIDDADRSKLGLKQIFSSYAP